MTPATDPPDALPATATNHALSPLGSPDGRPRTVMLDPGNFVPYYVDSLCGSLWELGLTIHVITSPPLFEPVDPAGRYHVDWLFFSFLDGRIKALVRRRRRLRQALKAISYPVGLWRTWRALRSGFPGVLHLQWVPLPALDGLLVRALKTRGWRVLFTAHDPLPGSTRPMAYRQHRWLLGLSDAVIVHTPQQARQLSDAYPDVAERVHVIPHGGAVSPFPSSAEQAQARRFLGIEADRPLLLFFGMIKPYKGLEYLLAAMPGVLAQFPRTLLLIAGEPLMSLRPVEQQIAQLGLGNAVSLRPRFIPQGEVPQYLRAADLLIAPYVDIGASGVVALAQGHGRPVVVTRVGGLPEFVERDQCGFVVPQRSPEALAEAICRGLSDPEALAEMGRRAQRRIERENLWSHVARQTLDLYRPASGRAPGPPRTRG